MTQPINESQIQENLHASKLMLIIAARLSTDLLSFSGWLVAGFGAAIGLLISNIQSVSGFISPSSLSYSLKLYLAAVIFHAVQRYLANIVLSSVAAGKEAESIQIEPNININNVTAQLEQAMFWPTHYLVRWATNRVRAGDFAVVGRMNVKNAQIQAWLVFIQLVLLIVSAFIIANALHG